jgi:hypothetical protein
MRPPSTAVPLTHQSSGDSTASSATRSAGTPPRPSAKKAAAYRFHVYRVSAARDAPRLESEGIQSRALLKPWPRLPGPDADDPKRALRRYRKIKRYPQDVPALLAV